MIQMTEAKLADLLDRAYSSGVKSVWEWRRKVNDIPRLQDIPKLNAIRAAALAPLIEEAKQK